MEFSHFAYSLVGFVLCVRAALGDLYGILTALTVGVLLACSSKMVFSVSCIEKICKMSFFNVQFFFNFSAGFIHPIQKPMISFERAKRESSFYIHI